MRIAFFASGVPWIKPSGGREQRVWEIAKHLAKKHEIILVCPGYDKKENTHETKDNIKITYTRPFFPTGIHKLDILFSKLYFLTDADKFYDDIDVWYCSRAPLGIIFSKARKIADCGRLWIWHWSPITLIDNFSNLLGYFFSDIKIFNAEKNRAKGIVINPGIDLKRFKPAKSRKLYDCLFVGRGEKAKGIKDFIKLAKLMPDKRFCIAGDYKGKYPKNVVCLGHVDMPKIYNQSRFLIQTSYGESYSQTVLEALACGLHVISYNTIATEFYPYCEIIKKGNYNAMNWKIMQLWDKKKIIPKGWLKQFDKEVYLKNIENAVCKD